MENNQKLIQQAALVIARRLQQLETATLQDIVNHPEYLTVILDDNFGAQARREQLIDGTFSTLDDDEVRYAIDEANDNGDYSFIRELSRTELETNLVEAFRRFKNADNDAYRYESDLKHLRNH